MKEDIMMQVWVIYFLRKWGTFSLFVLMSLVSLLLIDVVSVVNNAFTSIQASGSVLGFFNAAFSQSVLLMKIFLVAELIVALILAKNLISSLFFQRQSFTLAR